MKRRAGALALVWLFVILAGAPALAQEGTEHFQNDDTREVYPEYRETLAEYQRVSEADEACTDDPDCGYDRGQELGQQQIELYDELALASEDLAYARLGAIQEAPVTDPAEERIDAEEEKYDALQSLEAWADEHTAIESDATEDVGDELEATEDRIEELQAAEEQAAEDPAAEREAAGPAGGVGSAEDDGGGFYLLPALAIVGVLLYFSTSILKNLAGTRHRAKGTKRKPATPLAPHPTPSASSGRAAPRPPDPPPASEAPSSAPPTSEPRREPVADRTAGGDEGEAEPTYQKYEARRRSDVPPPEDDAGRTCPSCDGVVGPRARFCGNCGELIGER